MIYHSRKRGIANSQSFPPVTEYTVLRDDAGNGSSQPTYHATANPDGRLLVVNFAKLESVFLVTESGTTQGVAPEMMRLLASWSKPRKKGGRDATDAEPWLCSKRAVTT